MNINTFLDLVCNEIKYKPIRNDIAEELKNHINEIKQEYIDKGLESNKAEDKAVEQMGNPKEIGLKLNKIHKPKLDWKLLIIMIITLGFSLLVTFTRASNISQNNEIDVMIKYIAFMVIGIILSVICYFVDYRKLLKHSNKLFIIASLSIIVSITFGTNLRGVSHFRIGTYMFSPSVIAMPLYILSFVGFLENINKENKVKVKFLKEKVNINIIKIIISSIFSLYLLSLIPSQVTAFIVFLTYLILATRKLLQINKNIKRNIGLLWGVPVVLIFISVIIMANSPLGLFRFNRITASFNPESDPNGAGWIGTNQNLIINSAQLIGESENMSNALNIFDEGTNYALISLLAHYGWITSGLMILIVVLLSMKLIINAIKVKDIYGKNIIIGIATMFILQSICNILMNLNLGIQADFNIPFISYGGANLIANMVCISLVFSVYRRKNIILKNNEMKISIS